MKNLIFIGLLVLSFQALAHNNPVDGEGPGNNIRVDQLGNNQGALVVISGAEATTLFNFLKVNEKRSEDEGVLIIEKKTPSLTCRYVESEENYKGHECFIQINNSGKKIN